MKGKEKTRDVKYYSVRSFHKIQRNETERRHNRNILVSASADFQCESTFNSPWSNIFFSVTMENIQEMMRDPNALVFSWTV